MTSTATPPAPDSPSSLPRMTQEFGTAPAVTGTPGPGPRGHIGWIVACSLATGILAAVLLVAAPFIPAEESDLTGAVLCGFALGWAMLAVLSVRFTDQPQRWAAAPAVLMAVMGVASLSGSAAVHAALGWVWPPALLGLVVWMFLRVRRRLRSRGARWLLYPVLAVLVVASIGGGFQTVSETLDARAYPPPGQLVDVGGRKLHLHCTGSGSPTVVLEPGHGGSSSDLGWIAPAIARDSRVCVYDRAGRGWSDRRRRSAGRRPDRGGPATHSSIAHMFPGRTFLPVTPSAASTR